MKTIFDKTTRDEVLARINTLQPNSAAQWGKMNVAQMIKHCSQWDEMALEKTHYKQAFIGKLFGKLALKDMMKDEPPKRNMPTVPSFRIKETPDFAKEKNKWIELLHEYENYPGDGFMHPFFGQLTKEQTGLMVYKHVDHHLRQFNS